MRAEAHRLHPQATLRWLDGRLPDMTGPIRAGLSADVILLSAVWMHVRPTDRPRAFRKLVSLLRPGGLLAITLRDGPEEPGRGMHPVSLPEIERLAADHGLAIVRVHRQPDLRGRPNLSWTCVAIRLPDDGTGALPLLRHIILRDDKSATYKLGLLRSLCRIADGWAGMTRETEDGHVALPLGLVGLTWLRLYWPLAKADLPQSSANTKGAHRLGFAGEGFAALLAGVLSPLDLRVGASFTGMTAVALHLALRDACGTITDMPAHFMTYPGSSRSILPVTKGRTAAPREGMTIDAARLWSYGEMRVPGELWRALQRFAVWVEPSLIAEWTRLMRGYADRQGRRLDEGQIAVAMTWADPERDVSASRMISLQMIQAGRPVRCVWTGVDLSLASLDIDHALPWAAWPCGDLWNLLPAHRRVNQHQKRDRLPSEAILQRAHDGILHWWDAAYLNRQDTVATRFSEEAKASLPGLRGPGQDASPEEIFTAMGLQRLRLRLDQGVPEWFG
jgi:SAM-dependent methyltransferase